MKHTQRGLLKNALVIGTLGVATLGLGSGLAHADAPLEWTDVTANYVTPFDRGAFTDLADHPLIISPYGTKAKIECRSFHGQSAGCRQIDPSGEAHDLHDVTIGGRLVQIYAPTFGSSE